MRKVIIKKGNTALYNLAVAKSGKDTVYALSDFETNELLITMTDSLNGFQFHFFRDSIKTHLTNELAMSNGLVNELRLILDYKDNMKYNGYRYVSSEQNKKCGKCGEVKNASHFSKHSFTSDGLQSYCKGCVTEIGRIRRGQRNKLK